MTVTLHDHEIRFNGQLVGFIVAPLHLDVNVRGWFERADDLIAQRESEEEDRQDVIERLAGEKSDLEERVEQLEAEAEAYRERISELETENTDE